MNRQSDINYRAPKVSVIMPCFNATDFVAESIESVLNQTFTDFELILIDDGSTDATLGILKQYAAKDNRIVVIEKENTGPADSRNWGIRVSKGDWIAILDSDDIAMPTRLELQLAYVVNDPNLVALGSDSISINSSGHVGKKNTILSSQTLRFSETVATMLQHDFSGSFFVYVQDGNSKTHWGI